MNKTSNQKLWLEISLIVIGIIGSFVITWILQLQTTVKPQLDLREVGGISQIFLGDTQITRENRTHTPPVQDGIFAAWTTESDQGWQIWQANLTANTQIELFRQGNNVNPQIRDQHIIWEGQVEGIWQIMWFDGVQIRQISDGELPKQNPKFLDNKIVYEQRDQSAQITRKEFTMPAADRAN